jgi:hypothetical protein
MTRVAVRGVRRDALSIPRTKERKQQDLFPITLAGELEAGLVGNLRQRSQGYHGCGRW